MLPHRHAGLVVLAVAAALGAYAATPVSAQQPQPLSPPPAAPGCPTFGWQEGLGARFQQLDSKFPTQDTANENTPDCNFHQWSFEAFVWATTLINGVPRFLMLPTEEDLLTPLAAAAATVHPRALQLAARATVAHDLPGFAEGAGAFVQADGNVLVGPNGYPVYTSVHMNPPYFATARKNLIFGGAYQKGDPNETFPVGAAVFKATWRRLAPDEKPPTDAYVTQAQVPVLTVQRSATAITILPVPGKFVSATVVLVGLHVVGVTVNHPEMLWGTLEHYRNTPQVADNTFATSGSSSTDYTFYKANTSYADVNIKKLPPQLTFDTTTQRFSPVTNAVLENQTGGDTQPFGPGNVLIVSAEGQKFFSNEKNNKDKKVQAEAVFANYYLVGTVWMLPNSFTINSSRSDAVGSVNLANTTAETFQQYPTNADMTNVKNCFMCHNASSYSFQKTLPQLDKRLVAISHALSVGSDYAVPNMVSGSAPLLLIAP
jgi:hypothetical protein